MLWLSDVPPAVPLASMACTAPGLPGWMPLSDVSDTPLLPEPLPKSPARTSPGLPLVTLMLPALVMEPA